ncbi:MAG TPA: MarR family transcriptional regulator [Erythrobacter sp.]|nr:MarR family transcriptional regulator [Erythrobacter sp.]
MSDTLAQIVPQIRAFNRDFSQLMGLLDPHYMGSEMTVLEARVLYEIRENSPALARDIAAELNLDPGYLSRIVARLEKREWIQRGKGKDARQRPLALTKLGERKFRDLDEVTAAATARMIGRYGEDGARRIGALLSQAGELLFDKSPSDWSIRTFRPGDMGMITARQAILYREGWGWDYQLEALIGEITAKFLRDFKEVREQCWVAERDGRMLGVVFLIEDDEKTARLRLLHVEPEARGLGIGAALVHQCTLFAREAGYKRIALWTHAVLYSARRIYAAEGYEIISTHEHDDFGKMEKSEHWMLEL